MKAGVSKGLITALVVLGLLLPGLPILAEDRAGMFQPEAGLSSEPLSDSLARDVRELRANADEHRNVVVVVKLQGTPLPGIQQDRVIKELKGHAVHSQKSVLEFLETRGATVLNTFWLTSAILAEVQVDQLDAIASLPGVVRLFPNFEVTVPEPVNYEVLGDVGPDVVGNVTWGLDMIGSPRVWDMGINGTGVRVAVLDTGVDTTHPDLAGRMWSDDPEDPTFPGGWGEFDDYGNMVVSNPHDTHYHGTHVSGTVLGGDTIDIAIGVAPGAWLMHAIVLHGDSGTWAQVVAGMEWAVQPYDRLGEPAGQRADVINMSLGAEGFWHDLLIEPIESARDAGVVVIAAIGNAGEGTSGSPGNLKEAFGIGATNADDYVAGFSSGQLIDQPEYPQPYLKPDFTAPGVGVLSAIPLDYMPPYGWAWVSGTSMAAPHAAGVAALMLQADPTLDTDDIYDILKNTGVWYDAHYTARPCTRYGWGRINAYDAVSTVMFESGIEGTVTHDYTGDPIEGARVYIPGTGSVRFTDDSGDYRFHLPEGTYNVTAERFGYHADTGIDVVVAEDEFTIRDFALEPMPTGLIDGTVTDAETEIPIGGATITVLGTPLSNFTSEDGLYSIEAPIGTYDVMASSVLYVNSVALNVTVPEEGTVTVDFAVQPAWVAVLGDYHSQLTHLLIANGIWAEERGWDVIGDIHHYDAVVVNRPGDPGEETFLEFLEAADDNEVGVVFISSWPVGDSYGISLLHWYLGDPAGQSHDYESSSVYYEVVKPHPIFEDLGDTITIIDSGGKDYAWFWGYSGYTIAVIGSEDYGMQGNAVALNAYGNSLHVLLAGLAPQSFTSVSHWTEDAKTIFVRGVLVAGGRVDLDLVVSTTGLPAGMVNEEYHAAINSIGGSRPYTWDMIGGTMPPGIDFDTDTGVISGTPLEAGSFNFTMQATDDEGVAAAGDLSILVFEWLEFITDPEGDQFEGHGPDIVGLDFYRDEEAIFFRVRTAEPIDPYDTTNYMWLDLDLDPATGFVSPDSEMPTNDIGADAAAVIYPRQYDQGVMEEMFSLPIGRARDQRRSDTQPAQASFAGLRGELLLWDHYGEDFYCVGEFAVFVDTDHFRFAVPLDMLDDDEILGVVNVIGDFWEGFTDVAPNEGHGFTITPLEIATTRLPAGQVGVPYAATLEAVGGVPPYIWTMTAGGLSPGLAIDPFTGVIAGTPTTSGTFHFTVQGIDDTKRTATAALSITIVESVEIITTDLPPGQVEIPYEAALDAMGGVPPYSWNWTAEDEGQILPPDLDLDADTGLISGTPTEAGTFSFNVDVTDDARLTASQLLTIFIAWWDPWVYDEDGDGVIQKVEALQAVQDYLADKIAKAQVLEVVQLYFIG